MKKAIPFLLLVIFFIAAAWYSLMREPDPVHEIPPDLAPEPVEQAPPSEPIPIVTIDEEPTVELIPLPPLQESDAEITAELAKISGEDALAKYLVKEQLISRLVAVVDALDARQVPPQVNPFSGPEGKFKVTRDGDRITMSGENVGRYDAHVALFAQLDSQALNAIYDRYEPLFQQAWQDNGGEGPFKDRLLEIINHLLAAPEVAGEIELVKPEAVYLYTDPELEALSAGQKILLRMGPDNAAAVKAKLGEIRDWLLADTASIKSRHHPG